MGREQYRTPDEDIAQEFDRVCQLFQLALGKPSDRVLFQSLMGEANERGMNWIQGLEYVIEQRETTTQLEPPGKRPCSSAQDAFRGLGERVSDLRRAS